MCVPSLHVFPGPRAINSWTSTADTNCVWVRYGFKGKGGEYGVTRVEGVSGANGRRQMSWGLIYCFRLRRTMPLFVPLCDRFISEILWVPRKIRSSGNAHGNLTVLYIPLIVGHQFSENPPVVLRPRQRRRWQAVKARTRITSAASGNRYVPRKRRPKAFFTFPSSTGTNAKIFPVHFLTSKSQVNLTKGHANV